MNILINDPKNLAYLEKEITGIIVGLKSFSYGYETYYTPSKISEIKTDKSIFVSINKILHNEELTSLKEDLKALESIGVSGILFDDLAVLNIVKENNLNLKLIWAGNHLVNNYATINYYANKGCFGAMLSNELNKKEIEEIISHAKTNLFIQVYGYTNISYSYRHLLTNYCNYLDKEKALGNYFITVPNLEGKYPLVEEDTGTFIYSSKPINIVKELENKSITAVLNNYLISEEDFTKILTKYLNHEEIDLLDTDTGFFNKEVIVKNKKEVINK